jgi:hypothetical protein
MGSKGGQDLATALAFDRNLKKLWLRRVFSPFEFFLHISCSSCFNVLLCMFFLFILLFPNSRECWLVHMSSNLDFPQQISECRVFDWPGWGASDREDAADEPHIAPPRSVQYVCRAGS